MECYDHDGHLIEIELIETTLAQCRWLFIIDRERLGRSVNALKDRETARAEALSMARNEIARMREPQRA